METLKVTFSPRGNGWYRCFINGKPGEKTKNPKKMRFSLMRTHQAQNNPRLKEEAERKKREKEREKEYERWRLRYRPSFSW